MAGPKHIPPVPELSPLDAELRRMWDEAQRDFRKDTKKELRADPNKRLEDVLRELDNKYHPPGPDPKAKMRKTIENILKCIQLLGGLAAEGASVIFGPATLCFNAVSFLIDAPSRIAAVYEGVGNLFEEMSHTLVLFRIYSNYKTLDAELKDGTHRLMISFVRICGLSIKIIDGGSWHHIKVGAKVTFLNDDFGVKDELANFKALIEKQSNVTEALTLQHVIASEAGIAEILRESYLSAEQGNRMEAGINNLVADMSEKKTERVTSERVDAIARMLSVPSESVHGAKVALKEMAFAHLPGCSQWLFDLEAYKEWINPMAHHIPLLMLTGAPRTGKSFLVASIEADLRKNMPNVAIAYHTFTERDAKSIRDKDKDEVVSALKSMALQLAMQNKAYAKELSGLKETDFKHSETQKEFPTRQLWNKLRFSKSTESQDLCNFALLFDGIDQLSESDTQKFLDLLIIESNSSRNNPNRRKLRILTTGRNVNYNENIRNIQVFDHNQPDIRLYIERELDRDEVLQGQHVEMLDLLKSIREELPEVASGSYSIVDQKLARIREAVESDAYSDDLAAIISEDPAEDPNKLAWKAIGDLNAALNSHDIKQLNELLNWSIFGFQYFTIDELRAALFLKSGRSPLQPFEKKLKGKYKKVFKLDDDLVTVDDYIEDLFRSPEQATGEEVAVSNIEDAKITMSISINHADLRTVQQFCWDLTERVGIGKFDFSTGSSSKENKGTIHCNKVDAHYHMAEQLLNLLNDEPHEKTKALVKYALKYLPDHLEVVKDALDEDQLGPSARKAITKRLVDILSDIEGIEKFWDSIGNIDVYWATRERQLIIEGLLLDPKTMAQLEPKERRWVKQHIGGPEGKCGIYKPLTLMVARRWLQDRSWDALSAYQWVSSFMKLQEWKEADDGSDGGDGGDVDGDGGDCGDDGGDGGDGQLAGGDDSAIDGSTHGHGLSESDEIVAAAKWAVQALNAKENSLWSERIGQTCLRAFEPHAAVRWFAEAKSLADCHWTVNEGLALAYYDLGDLQSACREVEVVLTALRPLVKPSPGGEEHRGALVRNLKVLASWRGEMKETDLAFALYEEVLEVDPYEHETRCDLLRALYKENEEVKARGLFSQIEFPDFLRNITHLGDYLYHRPLDIIVLLSQTDEQFKQDTLESIQSAINNAKRIGQTEQLGMLLLYHGILLSRGATSDTFQKTAIEIWEQTMYLATDYSMDGSKVLATRYAMQYYFQLVTQASASTEDISQHLTDLKKVMRIASLRGGSAQNSFLASYYVLQGRPEEARKLFMEDMEFAMDIFSDDDPDNDKYEYKSLANILMYTGDDLDALSAWSLLGPDDTYFISVPDFPHTPDDDEGKAVVIDEEETATLPLPTPALPALRPGPLFYSCDGDCGTSWQYANDMYICRHCPNTRFDKKCLERLKSNKLEQFICHKDHSWLHIPAWSDAEAIEVGKGRVRVHGELVDGKRVGGEIMDVSKWLDEIREKWGISQSRKIELDSMST